MTGSQFWYTQHGDGGWEHQQGIEIGTLDNPGWWVTIELDGTEFEGRASHVSRRQAAIPSGFRVANPASRRRLVAKTGVQIVVVWGFALGVLPAVAVQVDRRMGWGRRGHRAAGAALVAAGSAIGLTSAWFMAAEGRGTPIPFDAARDLVVVGPYRIVRNPMAVSAIVQSAGVALALGSPTSALIPVSGAVVWNQVIRPSEEAFLTQRFGEPYRRYQRGVRCWVPTWPPYRPR